MKPTKERYESINRGYQYRLKQRLVLQERVEWASDAILEANILLVNAEDAHDANEAEIATLAIKVQVAKKEYDESIAVSPLQALDPFVTVIHGLKTLDGMGMVVDPAMQEQLRKFMEMISNCAATASASASMADTSTAPVAAPAATAAAAKGATAAVAPPVVANPYSGAAASAAATAAVAAPPPVSVPLPVSDPTL